jgi:hypothetical protein
VNWVVFDNDWEAEFCRVAEAHPACWPTWQKRNRANPARQRLVQTRLPLHLPAATLNHHMAVTTLADSRYSGHEKTPESGL